MTTKTKKILSTITLFGIAGGILWTTSNLDYIQIGITLCFGRMFVKSATQKKLIKYAGTIIGLIGLIFLIGLGYLPLFSNNPNNEDFIATQSRHIIVNSPQETSVILVKQQGFTKQQEIFESDKEIMIKEAPISIISFNNKNLESEATMSIQFPNQTTIVVYPNSSFSLENSGNQQIIEKISGEMEYITGQGNQVVINKAELKKPTDFAAQGLWNQYNEKQRAYTLNKAGGPLMENQSVRAISHNILLLASQIRPIHYLPYLENEKTYKKILGWTEKETKTYENKSTEGTQNIVDQAQQAGSKTRFLQFLGK
ncbi:MAG: hypothetical protein WCO66_03205 [Candidatus Absconditabacteria bacterium]